MRSTKQEKLYRKHQKKVDTNVCSFCAIDKGSDQFVHGTKSFKIIKNKFPYSFWDGQDVQDHLMIVPRVHSDSLTFENDHQKVEYVDLLTYYEKNGYNIYARNIRSVLKSISHQHTHLIKPVGPVKRFVLAIRKPLIRIIR